MDWKFPIKCVYLQSDSPFLGDVPQERTSFLRMSDGKEIHAGKTAVSSCTDGAVGVSGVKWYAAILKRPRAEKITAEQLTMQGYEVYIATQKILRHWGNGKRKFIDHVVIPAVIFIHCTEDERLAAVHHPYIARYMVNRADSNKVAVIPDKQIDCLKFILGQSDVPVEFVPTEYKCGDRVRVIRGSLLGLEGEVVDLNSAKSELTIVIPNFGCAKLILDTVNLELIR